MSEELRWILLVFGAALLAWIYFADKWRTRRSGGSRASSHTQIEDAAGNAITPPSAAVSPATVPIGSVSIATVPIDWTVPLTEPEAEMLESLDATDDEASAAERRTGERRRRRMPSLAAASDTDTRPVDPARRAAAQEPRKIITLRLSAAPSFDGQDVQATLEAVELGFGKHEVFHRLTAEGAVVFSVASMTEPGTFDVERMSQTRFVGLILYALLPGPLDGPTTFTQLLNAATQLQQALGGELQDERGVTLTSYRINRIRDEVAALRAAAAPLKSSKF